jgi:ribonuclease R
MLQLGHKGEDHMTVNRTRLIELMNTKVYKPLQEDELIALLAEHEGDRDAWKALVLDMEQEGEIIRTRYGRFGLPEKMNLMVGVLQGHPQGYAFLVPDKTSGLSDLYIPSHALGGAIHRDKVVARIVSKPGRERRGEGEIIRILKRAHETLVGRFEGVRGAAGFVTPDEKRLPFDVLIPQGKTKDADGGDKVVVRITKWPLRRQPPEGEVVEVLGATGEPGVAVTAVSRQFNLPREFPEAVEREVVRISPEVREEDLKGRRDLRGLPMVTIDGADAKDLDDAVSVELVGDNRYRLGVHIADVSHYVRPHTHLDREALERGTSIYLLDRVIPMLPKELSNGICSLNPRVDRLALSIFMEIDQNGTVLEHEIVESVIRTNERMTYDEVNRVLLDRDAALLERYSEQVQHFELMAELRNLLLKKRENRGAIEFELSESKIMLDEKGRVLDIVPRQKTLADSIIEEFMLAANETVAEHFHWMEVPFVYRVHEEPSIDKVGDLNVFLNNFSLRIKARADELHPRAFQSVLRGIAGQPEERLIHRVLLRTMMRARYSPECLGHFGLAAKYYCHFTSPIRRYPDLLIHRIIKMHLQRGKLTEKEQVDLTGYVEVASKLSSEREQLATEAERAVDSIKKAEFMADKVGQEFDGMISGVINYGFFVELDNTVEGMVHVSALDDDYYDFDPDSFSLQGRRTKKRFRLGDRVRVGVDKVNVEESTIDFRLAK